MYWFPFAILAKKALDAAIRYDEKQSARFRCRICWTNNHTTEEHQHPQLNARSKVGAGKVPDCSSLLPCRMGWNPRAPHPGQLVPSLGRVADPMARLGLGSGLPNPEGTTEGE